MYQIIHLKDRFEAPTILRLGILQLRFGELKSAEAEKDFTSHGLTTGDFRGDGLKNEKKCRSNR